MLIVSNQTVLVTGATGLLGRQVLREFKIRGWETTGVGYSRADGTDILKADLSNKEEVAKLLDNVKWVSYLSFTCEEKYTQC